VAGAFERRRREGGEEMDEEMEEVEFDSRKEELGRPKKLRSF
jgi:hypothetical protein